jgi:lipoprotein-anchoring transpeptidase ErfK/SrfK
VPTRRTAVVLGLGLAVGVGVTGTALRATANHGRAGPGSAATALSAAAGDLPRPERPAFVIGTPVRLPQGENAARFAPVTRTVVARRRPSTDARPVASLALETPEATTNLVLVLGEAIRPDGEWVHVRLPVLPNDQTAWVSRRALGGYHFLHTRLVVERERLRATLFDNGRPIFSAPIGIGRSESPTPAGEFYIRDKVSGFGNPFYGPIAYGTSARSAVLTDWPGGGFVGIHGTNEPDLIPGRISHGCIRMRNPDILRLSRLMPVGTPITIE